MNAPAKASVVIPAHDEQDAIATTLAALQDGWGAGDHLEIVVVCNGCTDATAEVARAAGVSVVEIDAASKIEALREGDRYAATFPRIYLDADVVLRGDSALALAEAVSRPGVRAGGMLPVIDTSASSTLVRWYFDFRQRLPVFRQGIIGAGVYAMSEAGRARFDEWPDVLGDDQFVLRLFDTAERVTLTGHHTTVRAPRDMRTVVRRGVRIRRGNRDLTAGVAGRDLPSPPAGLASALRWALVSPRRWPAAATWLATTATIRMVTRLRPAAGDWQAARELRDTDGVWS